MNAEYKPHGLVGRMKGTLDNARETGWIDHAELYGVLCSTQTGAVHID